MNLWSARGTRSLRWSSAVLAAAFALPLAAQGVREGVIPPVPPTKPAISDVERGDVAVEDLEPETRYRPGLLFEGGIGDQVAGEGVVILGKASGSQDLSLELIEQLGLCDGAASSLCDDETQDGSVLDESPAAKALRDRRAALQDLLKREQAISFDIAEIKALDKVTGQISEFKIPVNDTITFGDLLIKARSCQKSPPGEPPERAAFLQITDSKRKPDDGNSSKYAFSGWMLSSNPSISAMDHAIYDVWVVGCGSSSFSKDG